MTSVHDTVVDFVKVLRTADIKVSPAETLDAMEAELDLSGHNPGIYLIRMHGRSGSNNTKIQVL